MIDNLKITIICIPLAYYFHDKTNSFKYNGIIFNPEIWETNVICWKANLKNLHLVFRKDELTITNSIHKFHCGNNYSDFTHELLIQAFINLSEMLNIDLSNAKIKKIEYGCNIELSQINQLLECIIAYKSKQFMPMHFKGIIYGKNVVFSDYFIKLYNKQQEVKIHDKTTIGTPLLRYEKGIINMRHLKQKAINIVTVSDLLMIDNLKLLADDLIVCFREIQKKQFVDLEALKIEELKKYCLLENQEAQKVALKKHRVSVKRYLKEFEDKTDTNFYHHVESLISQKLYSLLS